MKQYIYYYTETDINRLTRKHPEITFKVFEDWKRGMDKWDICSKYGIYPTALRVLENWFVKF